MQGCWAEHSHLLDHTLAQVRSGDSHSLEQLVGVAFGGAHNGEELVEFAAVAAATPLHESKSPIRGFVADLAVQLCVVVGEFPIADAVFSEDPAHGFVAAEFDEKLTGAVMPAALGRTPSARARTWFEGAGEAHVWTLTTGDRRGKKTASSGARRL